jgi:hypothetical protein
VTEEYRIEKTFGPLRTARQVDEEAELEGDSEMRREPSPVRQPQDLHDLLRLECDAPPVLVKLMRMALMPLMFMQVNKAARIEGSEIAHLKPESGPPRPVEDLVSEWAREFRRAKTNTERLLVIKETQELVTSLKFAPVVEGIGLRRGTLDFKIAVARDARSARVVAQVYDLTPAQVRAWRRRYGREEAA